MKVFAKYLLWFVIFLFVSSVLSVVAYRFLPVSVTPLMVIRAFEGEDSLGWEWKHDWVSKEDMSPYASLAVVASEDQKFMSHNGFDMEAIMAAYEEAKAGGRVRGGSTISQQTAKNVFLWPNSSWVRKGLEVYFTFLVETFWSKERILEVYLNSIEMGQGIYGLEAVAQEHFHCAAKDLTAAQCALIAATLPNPRKFSSLHPSAYMKKREKRILKEMRHIDLETLTPKTK